MTSDGPIGTHRPGIRLIGVLVLALALALTGALAVGTPTAQAKYKQPGCAKAKNKLKKAKGKAAKQRLKRSFKQCQANRKVYNQVKDSRFTGTREDGLPVDIVLCANGKLADDPDGQFGKTYKKGWRITEATIRGKNFTAVYEAFISRSTVGNTGQFQVATRSGSLARKNGKWQSGAESFGAPFLLGDVKKTDARKQCRNL